MNGVGQQILHLIEQKKGVAAAPEDVLNEDQFLQPLASVGFPAFIVGFADAVERYPQPDRKGSAELGLAGTRGTVQQHVDAGSVGLQRTLDQALDMVSALCHVVEIGPEKVARGRSAEQQLPNIASRIGRCERQPLQSVDDADVSILVDVYESFAYEGPVRAQACGTGVVRQAEQVRQHSIAQCQSEIAVWNTP